MEQVKSKKKGIIIAGISAIVLIAVLDISFAFWNYSRTADNQLLVAGDIYMKYTEPTLSLSIPNAMPSNGPDESKHFDFTIEGRNKYSKPIWYEIVLSQGEEEETKTRLKDEFLRFRLVEIKGEERKVVADNISYSDLETGKRIWVNTINAKTDNIEIKYELYMWIAFETKIGNTEGNDYTIDEWKDVYASIKVSVNGDFERKKIDLPESAQKVYDKAKEKQECNPIIEDEDGTIYFSGDNTCIDFNYVWYSGKLWRITAINPDGTMKMITQDAITAISWNANNTYKDSWIYQWLNEDFKETLYNYQNIIVQNADWNATETKSYDTKIPKTTIVQGDVGLLNAYEYYQSYKNLESFYNVYLDIGYCWWLITPHSNSNVWYVYSQMFSMSNGTSTASFSVRPSINLKSNIELSGEGTKRNPYTITIDKATGTPGESINTRLSGEYVKVDNKVYRIVGIEDGTTKLTSVDYVRDGSGTVLTKGLGSKGWDASVTSENEDYWGYYLNKKWLTPELEEYIIKGTYYLGQYPTGVSYKNTICSESNTSKPISSCTKTSSRWEGLVGLSRVGEMFSAQLADKQNGSTLSSMVLINQRQNPYDPGVYYLDISITEDGGVVDSSFSSNFAARPSINLKSEVKIISGEGETPGDGKTPETAYEVGLIKE